MESSPNCSVFQIWMFRKAGFNKEKPNQTHKETENLKRYLCTQCCKARGITPLTKFGDRKQLWVDPAEDTLDSCGYGFLFMYLFLQPPLCPGCPVFCSTTMQASVPRMTLMTHEAKRHVVKPPHNSEAPSHEAILNAFPNTPEQAVWVFPPSLKPSTYSF